MRQQGGGGPKLKKMLRRMAVLTAGCLWLAVNAAAQGGPMVMPSRETTLKEALEELRRQTGYMPVINYDNIEPSRKVTLSSENLDADELIGSIL